MALEENPAKMTEWVAPILEQANIDATAIGDTGKWLKDYSIPDFSTQNIQLGLFNPSVKT